MAYRNRSKEESRRMNIKYYNKTSNAYNSKNLFDEKELLLIWQHNITDRELSKLIGRSMMGIQIARSRMRTGIIKVDWLSNYS